MWYECGLGRPRCLHLKDVRLGTLVVDVERDLFTFERRELDDLCGDVLGIIDRRANEPQLLHGLLIFRNLEVARLDGAKLDGDRSDLLDLAVPEKLQILHTDVDANHRVLQRIGGRNHGKAHLGRRPETREGSGVKLGTVEPFVVNGEVTAKTLGSVRGVLVGWNGKSP